MFIVPPKGVPDPLTLTRCGRTAVSVPREDVDARTVRNHI
ncbi:unnamed protein product [Nippostrongylus brasiliensis]|uniref:Transposase n=1 Tax=Nippostrongylus brasiliensis TaxID=27835 RepID=A0A0N4XNL4_NIPBR|nr:unnamed protein product [Nippostrongylus brasiliensis]